MTRGTKQKWRLEKSESKARRGDALIQEKRGDADLSINLWVHVLAMMETMMTTASQFLLMGAADC